MKKPNLKKTVMYLSLLLTFALTLSACTNQASNTKTPNNTGIKRPPTEKPVDVEISENQADNTSASEENITKQDIADLILNSDFDSSDFLRNVKSSIQDLEMQAALQESNKEKSITSCEKISKKELKENCENTYYYQQAFEDKDIELCKKITIDYQQKDCINQTNYNLAIEKMDETLCNEITEEYQQKDCKNSVAYTKARKDLDPTLCDKIENEETANMCKEDIKMIIEINRENEAMINTPEIITDEPVMENENAEVNNEDPVMENEPEAVITEDPVMENENAEVNNEAPMMPIDPENPQMPPLEPETVN